MMTRIDSRSSVIRKELYNDEGNRGPDMIYVVDLLDNDQLIETRKLPGKSIYYAEDVAENWEIGIINIQ